MKKKTWIAIAVAVVLLVAAVVCWLLFAPGTEAGDKSLTVLITHTDGSERELALQTDGAYLWDALEPTGLFDGEDGEYGLMIDTVDGEYADPDEGAYWLFTKDGAWVDYGVSAAPIADGEHYEFFVETY